MGSDVKDGLQLAYYAGSVLSIQQSPNGEAGGTTVNNIQIELTANMRNVYPQPVPNMGSIQVSFLPLHWCWVKWLECLALLHYYPDAHLFNYWVNHFLEVERPFNPEMPTLFMYAHDQL